MTKEHLAKANEVARELASQVWAANSALRALGLSFDEANEWLSTGLPVSLWETCRHVEPDLNLLRRKLGSLP